MTKQFYKFHWRADLPADDGVVGGGPHLELLLPLFNGNSWVAENDWKAKW